MAHLTETCELIFASEPNARTIIIGDINHLNIRDLISQHNLKQLVTKSTRDDKILDVFLTDSSHLWKTSVVFKSLVRSDHLSVKVSASQPARPERRYVSFRDVREHHKLALQHKLEGFDCHWKLANVTPIPKESPLTNCNQLRPISLTNIIIRLFKKVILKFEKGNTQV